MRSTKIKPTKKSKSVKNPEKQLEEVMSKLKLVDTKIKENRESKVVEEKSEEEFHSSQFSEAMADRNVDFRAPVLESNENQPVTNLEEFAKEVPSQINAGKSETGYSAKSESNYGAPMYSGSGTYENKNYSLSESRDVFGITGESRGSISSPFIRRTDMLQQDEFSRGMQHFSANEEERVKEEQEKRRLPFESRKNE